MWVFIVLFKIKGTFLVTKLVGFVKVFAILFRHFRATGLGSTAPVWNSASLVFHWNVGPSGWDFSAPTEHQWWILFVFYRITRFWQYSKWMTLGYGIHRFMAIQQRNTDFWFWGIRSVLLNISIMFQNLCLNIRLHTRTHAQSCCVARKQYFWYVRTAMT